jgi:hypothetical protein
MLYEVYRITTYFAMYIALRYLRRAWGSRLRRLSDSGRETLLPPRKQCAAALDRAWKRQGAGGQMLLLYGRRRLGKTFLLQRYFTAGARGQEPEKPHCYFLAEQSTAVTQRLTLARQLVAALPAEGVAAEEIAVSWNALLRYASQQSQPRKKSSGRFALILDEFPRLLSCLPYCRRGGTAKAPILLSS